MDSEIKIKCIKCGHLMQVDQVDRLPDNGLNVYLKCTNNNCTVSTVRQIFHGKPFRQIWWEGICGIKTEYFDGGELNEQS